MQWKFTDIKSQEVSRPVFHTENSLSCPDIVAWAGQLQLYVLLVALVYNFVLSNHLLFFNYFKWINYQMVYSLWYGKISRYLPCREMACKDDNFYQQISGNVANTYLGMWSIEYCLHINSPACDVSGDGLNGKIDLPLWYSAGVFQISQLVVNVVFRFS